jgi:hypothetical protein
MCCDSSQILDLPCAPPMQPTEVATDDVEAGELATA